MLTNTKWSHLPNAAHIDRIFASVNLHPDQWVMAKDEVVMKLAPNATRGIARSATLKEVKITGQYATSEATRLAVRKTTQRELRYVVWDALICLIAYDDCAYMLDSEVDELKILAAFGDPKAILLLPACIALQSINQSIDSIT